MDPPAHRHHSLGQLLLLQDNRRSHLPHNLAWDLNKAQQELLQLQVVEPALHLRC